jgi:ActR/RegA family two-component response regulator
MVSSKILLVEDPDNLLNSTIQAVNELKCQVKIAKNITEGLAYLEEEAFNLMILNLDVTENQRLEFMSQAIDLHPDLKVIVIDLNATIEEAIAAMKLGGVDFLNRRLSLEEMKQVIQTMLTQKIINYHTKLDYHSYLKLAKYWANKEEFDSALALINQAIGIDPSCPEGFNILGELQESMSNFSDALKNYRAAIALDPTYKPAINNLDRATSKPLHIHKYH